jgi:NTE family protein
MVDPVPIDLALQGGGAHAAFTWGILDRLLDERGLHYVAISGASAGAMNAVVFADGLLSGGRAGAQKALWAFWKAISRAAHRAPPAHNPFYAFFLTTGGGLLPPWLTSGPWAASMEMWRTFADSFALTFSPYQWNPFNINPLADIVRDSVDFERLKRTGEIGLFVSATSVQTGMLRIFRNSELSAEVIMASACLPQLFQAVEIDGNTYWDGGYLGNPPLLPLIAESDPSDLLIIQLNPASRRDRPRNAGDIAGRLNEITFNACLVQELKHLALLKRALSEEPPDHSFQQDVFNRVRRLNIHRIAADEAAYGRGPRSKLDPEWEFLMRLHGLGARAADAWLKQHWDDLGRRSTLELDTLIA